MAKEIVDWITINGNHIPIFEGESKQDAYNRAVAKANEDKKTSDIEKHDKVAKELNKNGITKDSTPSEIKSHYKSKYNINIDDSYFEQNNDKRILAETDKLLSRLYSELPLSDMPELQLTASKFSEDKRIKNKDAFAVSACNYSGMIVVNSDDFESYKGIERQFEQKRRDGKSVIGGPASILIHEVGHQIEHLIARKSGISEIDAFKNGTATAIVKASFDELPKGTYKDMTDARKSISTYANTEFEFLEDVFIPCYEETFAEAVSDYVTNGAKASEFSKQIIKNIKSALS